MMQISDSLEPRKLDANDGADCRGGTASLQTVTGCKFHLAGPAQGRQGHCGEGMVAHSAAADTQDGISTVFLKPKTGRSKILEQLQPYPTPHTGSQNPALILLIL